MLSSACDTQDPQRMEGVQSWKLKSQGPTALSLELSAARAGLPSSSVTSRERQNQAGNRRGPWHHTCDGLSLSPDPPQSRDCQDRSH